VLLAYSDDMHLEPFREISWAFQLHYHICFRTHRRRPFFDEPARAAALAGALADICSLKAVHLLEKRQEPGSVQLVISLRPNQIISEVLKAVKTASSTAVCREFGIVAPLWARGYLARSLGSVRLQAVKQYIALQAEHHGYDKRMRPPIFRFRAAAPRELTTAHASFDLTHHLVVATKFRSAVFGAKTGEALVNYWMKVAAKRGFAIDRVTVLPDHVHLLVRITPKISVEQVTLCLINNAQYFMGKNFPGALVDAKIDQLWQPSAYAGSCGELPTALLKAFLRRAD
jgi:putative transposase